MHEMEGWMRTNNGLLIQAGAYLGRASLPVPASATSGGATSGWASLFVDVIAGAGPEPA